MQRSALRPYRKYQLEKSIDAICGRGLAFPALFDRLEDFRDGSGEANFIVAFQLPYSLDIDFEQYRGRSDLQDVYVDLEFFPAVTSIDARLNRKIAPTTEAQTLDAGMTGHIPCTQCLAKVNLWGRRQKYYDRYVDLSLRKLENEIVIPEDDKPYTWNRPGAVTAKSYEDEVAYLTIAQAATATRKFLRDYMAVSLHEVEIPKMLYSAFASSRFEKYFPLGNSPDLLAGLLPKINPKSLQKARKQDVLNASQRRVRDFSPFEGQILALKRLSDQGEPELALIGLMALIEWLLKESLPKSLQKENKRQNTARHVFRKSKEFFEASEHIWGAIEIGFDHRNYHVHEKPTTRSNTYDPSSARSQDTSIVILFNDTALAAISLFKAINRS
jgi:hypothetical protein